jgi:hypothetical protein
MSVLLYLHLPITPFHLYSHADGASQAGLTGSETAGISIGVILFVSAGLLLLCVAYKKRKKQTVAIEPLLSSVMLRTTQLAAVTLHVFDASHNALPNRRASNSVEEEEEKACIEPMKPSSSSSSSSDTFDDVTEFSESHVSDVEESVFEVSVYSQSVSEVEEESAEVIDLSSSAMASSDEE